MPSRHPPGFSLIEAAIVLGIVGLVIGGIWAATNSVQQRRKIEANILLLEATLQHARTYAPRLKDTDMVDPMRTLSMTNKVPVNGYVLRDLGGGGPWYLMGNGMAVDGWVWGAGSGYPPGYQLWIYFSSSYPSNLRANPSLCSALVRHFLKSSKSYTTDQYSFLFTFGGGANQIMWDASSPIPSDAQIAAACAHAGSYGMEVDGSL